jgi:hypothetical protein
MRTYETTVDSTNLQSIHLSSIFIQSSVPLSAILFRGLGYELSYIVLFFRIIPTGVRRDLISMMVYQDFPDIYVLFLIIPTGVRGDLIFQDRILGLSRYLRIIPVIPTGVRGHLNFYDCIP